MRIKSCRLLQSAAVGLFILTACKGTMPSAPPQYKPAESLLSIVAEFQRYRDADLYRFYYPRDVSGQNVFKATVVRLGNYETLNPKKYTELIAFTRAMAYARLGDYATAARFCKQVESLGGELKDRASADLKIIEAFRQATTLAERAKTFSAFQQVLEERIRRCRELVDRYSKPPWNSLAKCEWEQAEVDRVEFLWANRQILANGPAEAFDAMAELRNHHRESKNFYRHTLRLGDWAAEMASEYTILAPPERSLPPDRVSFVWEDFERWTSMARTHYREVAQSYGAEERLEAIRKLAALEAFEHRIRQLHE